MDTRELPKALEDLEREIGLLIRDKVTAFNKETGLCITAIVLNFDEVTTSGDRLRQFQLMEVSASLNI
ncbi:hypothetical protein [Neptuniibacter sp.]|uniref:hypothetical protein n=1 Tax=Neptuniibacter sp. TaxID=1962643 RepID=UPI002628E5A8|nr:hypothetical protein [Neptuniibacter sp.]MCP4597794.1 hypothetical protein [Neptuniibacter sp.]